MYHLSTLGLPLFVRSQDFVSVRMFMSGIIVTSLFPGILGNGSVFYKTVPDWGTKPDAT